MSRIQNINEKYEVSNLFKSKIFKKFPKFNFAKAIIVNISGTTIELKCFFYYPRAGAILKFRENSALFTPIMATERQNIFITNVIGTLNVSIPSAQIGDIVEYNYVYEVSTETRIPEPFPFSYGMCQRNEDLSWTVSNLIGSLTSLTNVRFIFQDNTSQDASIIVISSSRFTTPLLNLEPYHQTPQFFYSIN